MSFVPDLPVLAAFVLAAVVLTVTPGPDMTLFIGKTLSQGRKAGFAAMLGASSGIVVHTLLAAFGLSALLAASETAFGIVKVAGAAFLLWLAYDALRHGSALTIRREHTAPASTGATYLMGLGINLLNPKVVLFFVTFLPQFVTASDPNASAKLTFLGLTFILVAIPICGLMILFAERFTAALKRSPRAARLFDWMFASLMGGFAVKILLARGAH